MLLLLTPAEEAVTLSEARTFRVEPEGREFAVDRESRVFAVAPESRVWVA